MIFDFIEFLNELPSTERGSKLIEEYTEIYGSFPEALENCAFFEYLNTFNVLDYTIPEFSEDDFDWGLLLKLVSASLSSEYWFAFEDNATTPDLYIRVKSGEQTVVKTVGELWDFQVKRLFEIYFFELFDFDVLRKDELERESILFQRQLKIKESKEKQLAVFNQKTNKKYSSTIDDMLNTPF
jgi:hypothetical protein